MTRNHLFHAAASFVAAIFLLGLTGCSSKLDTGYEPRKLGASDEARRGFYAQPFTPEAKAAKQYEQDFGDVHRPRPGY
jgi:hypothetical protein